MLKQFNFNAVRTSHYPPVNKYLELANEYGLYIIDEVGDEAHASEWISNLPEYEEMYRERSPLLGSSILASYTFFFSSSNMLFLLPDRASPNHTLNIPAFLGQTLCPQNPVTIFYSLQPFPSRKI